MRERAISAARLRRNECCSRWPVGSGGRIRSRLWRWHAAARRDEERFGRAVSRARSLIQAIQDGTPGPTRRARLLLTERGRIVVLAMRDIEFVQAAARRVKIHAAKPLLHGDCELVLRRGTSLTLSRRYRDRLSPFLFK